MERRVVKSSFALLLLTFLVPVFLFISCDTEKPQPRNGNKVIAHQPDSYMDSPAGSVTYPAGDSIPFRVRFHKKIDNFESVAIYLDDTLVYSSDKNLEEHIWYCTDSLIPMGKHSTRYELVKKDGKKESSNGSFNVCSGIAPKMYSVLRKRAFPHDTKAYTQGLEFHNGVLYEGTGLERESQLRETDYRTGAVKRSVQLADPFFGEGITIFDDKVYQLTYTHKKCFVYKLSDFSRLNEYFYDTQGWGLCNDGKQLIMSDGSSKLYFRDPQDFSLLRTIEVYDNRAPQYMLNELEYINGMIWANIYQSNLIAVIDPRTGRIVAKIDCGGIISPEEQQAGMDVLNGIAYDKSSGKIYITGKRWPLLFEIGWVETPA